MPVCPGCGASYEVTYQFCPHCGRAKPAPQQVNVTYEERVPRNACPECHKNDKVEKVSAIVNRDTVQISGSSQSTSTYVDRNGYTRHETSDNPFSGVQQSNLAARLSPPAKPEAKGACLRYLLYLPVLLLGGACFAMLTVAGPSQSGKTMAGVGMLVVILLLVWITLSIRNINRKAKEKQAQEMVRWNKAVARWEQLYYCHRDDVLFVPGQSETIPVQSMLDYLYR